jgi:polygalacturonase
MLKSFLIHLILILNILWLTSCAQRDITPNQFEGNDIQRIRSAIEAAKARTRKVIIPSRNANGTNLWLLDSAILIPGNMTVILDNCTIQLSDQCRDNMFRSENVGIGISDPVKSENISIIGMGEVILKGANNPRATGDGARTLTLNPAEEKEKGNWRVSYGSDAGKEGKKQKGDWRNIMILMAHIDGFTMKNINIENSHAWAVSFERVRNADISEIRIDNPEEININGKKVLVSNKDGINLRHGCKNFRINNISGRTGDDFIALSSLDTGADGHDNGNLNSTMVTSRKWKGPEDDTEEVVITNIACQTKYRGVAIRASDSAGIHDVYIDGLICREWEGYTNSILIGGLGYGKPSHPGKIKNIYATNITGSGRSLILIEAAIADCSFINGIYTGNGDHIITYKIDKSKTTNIIARNLIKAH